MTDILFVIPNLGHGGAEKVLINLVNHLDPVSYRVTVMTLYDEGINKASLKAHIQYKTCFRHSFPGVSHFLKLLSPRQLYRWLIKGHYDIVISYLEGQTARIVSGCPDDGTKLVSWVHCTMKSKQEISVGFRDFKEASLCYQRFDRHVFVSNGVKDAFCKLIPVPSPCVLYNTIDSANIINMSKQSVRSDNFPEEQYKLVAVGKLEKVKGFARLLRIHKRLFTQDHLPIHLYLLGEGMERKSLETLVTKSKLQSSVTFLGYQTNPYQYIAACDLFVCSSYSEGFSTAATEALIVGIPVITTEVSGMKEMLGDNEYGIITENEENALYHGIRDILTTPGKLTHYKNKAQERGNFFCTEKTVQAVEEMLMNLEDDKR